MRNEIIINDDNYLEYVGHEDADGNRKARGLNPRNFRLQPVGYHAKAPAFSLPLIPESEWADRLAARIAAKAQLSDVRNAGGPNGAPIPSRDQNGKGYCWGHSNTSAALLWRAKMGLPYADLSAYAVCCIIKGYRDEGGNCTDSIEFMADRGIPTSKYWPQQSMSRSNDNAETWKNAALHKFDAGWMDLDPSNMKAQMVTCMLLGIPMAGDFDWWGHSVGLMDLVSLNPFRIRIWNSWGDSWSDNGTGILEGRKAIPDGAVAATSFYASAA